MRRVGKGKKFFCTLCAALRCGVLRYAQKLRNMPQRNASGLNEP